jgi:hypothetical protein
MAACSDFCQLDIILHMFSIAFVFNDGYFFGPEEKNPFDLEMIEFPDRVGWVGHSVLRNKQVNAK